VLLEPNAFAMLTFWFTCNLNDVVPKPYFHGKLIDFVCLKYLSICQDEQNVFTIVWLLQQQDLFETARNVCVVFLSFESIRKTFFYILDSTENFSLIRGETSDHFGVFVE
jgi:hypothetical protein